jgi:hypothetical protein
MKRSLPAALVGVLMVGAIGSLLFFRDQAPTKHPVTAASVAVPEVSISLPSARILLLNPRATGSSGELPVEGRLGVSRQGCVTLTNQVERVVIASAGSELSADGTRVMLTDYGPAAIGAWIETAGWTRRRLDNLPDQRIVPRDYRRCGPGPFVYFDPM